MKTYLYAIGLCCILLAGASCSDPLEQEGKPAANESNLVISRTPFQIGGMSATLPGEDDLVSMKAYLFEDSLLQQVYEPVTVSEETYRLPLDRRSGTLYIVANESVSPEKGMTEQEWLQTTVTAEKQQAANFFTGKVNLSDYAPGATSIPLKLTRGVARFDLRIRVASQTAVVKQLEIKQVAQQGYLFPNETGESPEGAGKADYSLCSPDAPLKKDTPGLLYVYEQVNPDLRLRLEAEIDGQSYSFEEPLPEIIRRNTVYGVVLKKDMLDIKAQLTVEAWGEGGEAGLYPDLESRLRIDVAASELPEGVTVSAGKDGLRLPYEQTEMVLAIRCDDELELLPVDPSSAVTAEPVVQDGEFNGTQRFRIRKPLYPPGQPAVETALYFRRKGMLHTYPEDAISLQLEENGSLLSGKIDFAINRYAFDFEQYIDNELGVFTLPTGKELVAEYETGEDPWIKIAPIDGRPDSYRVLAGWKPNDPTANGRKQAAKLVIRNRADGSKREEYTVSRRNYGLPVTWFHGIWWCKYNARGDSRSFSDQILSSDDPARQAGQTLFQYLETCAPEDFLRLWNWSYQGESGEGLQTVEQNGKAMLDKYNHQVSTHINRLPAESLSPEGYELPSMDDYNRLFDATDYIWVMWNGTHTLRNPWEGHSQVKRIQKRRNNIPLGSLVLNDLIYIEMSSPDFPEHEPIVWYGPASQWNESDGIYHNGHYNNILFGVHSPEGSGWFIAGGINGLYLHKNAGSARDTRILRFRKSPVEYIYGLP